MTRYMLCPGYITSVNDGDRHWIGVKALVNLYGLRAGEYVVETDIKPKYRTEYVTLTPQRHSEDYDKIREKIAKSRMGNKND